MADSPLESKDPVPIASQIAAAYELLSDQGARISSETASFGSLWTKAQLLHLRTIEAAVQGGLENTQAAKQLSELRQQFMKDFLVFKTASNELHNKIAELERQIAELEKLRAPPAEQSTPTAGSSAKVPTQLESVVLKAALTRLGLIGPGEQLPPPDDFFSGVAGKSRVFLFFLKGPGEGRRIVAKFDNPERARVEWEAIRALRGLNIPAETVLPHPRNEETDGVIVYPVAQVHGLRRFDSCAGFFRDTLVAAPRNAIKCWELALEPLQFFYDCEPGRISDRNVVNGAPLQWSDFYDYIKPEVELRELASSAWSGMDWSAADVPLGPGVRTLPNPILGIDSRLKSKTGAVLLSRVHGDLNLTNILVWPDGDFTPLRVNLIDLAASSINQPTVSDLVQLEIGLWREVFFELLFSRGATEPQVVGEYLAITDYLDGRIGESPRLETDVGCGVLVLVYYLRRWAMRVLRVSPHRHYLLSDYYHCLHFRYLTMVNFYQTEEKVRDRRMMLLGAAVAQRVLLDQRRGAYSREATRPLMLPGREISELEAVCRSGTELPVGFGCGQST